MKHSFKLVLAGVALLAMGGVAQAETGKQYVPPKPVAGMPYQDAVRDTNGNPVHSTNGNCVRTHWSANCDVCAPPAPVVKAEIPLEERTFYFDFNKSTLTPEAKVKLAALVKKMEMHGPIKSVKIAGYADRLGNAVYNEKLSKKRADTVRKYLEAQGVANAMVVETRWFGDTVPATSCPKGMKRKELIKCLQPDRRVEVEVEFGVPGMMPVPPHAKKAHHHHKVKKAHKAAPAEAVAPKAKEEPKAKAKDGAKDTTKDEAVKKPKAKISE